MSYFAAAVVKDADRWSAAKVSLNGAADVEDVADRVRDVEPAAEISLLFVESDDSYLAILRLDHGEDLRIFGSDIAFAEESRLGALLLGDLGQPPAELASGILDVPDFDAEESESEEELESPPPASADPAGDADLLADLGLPAGRLLELCGHNGMLPSDITAEVCQAIGCGDEVEELREFSPEIRLLVKLRNSIQADLAFQANDAGQQAAAIPLRKKGNGLDTKAATSKRDLLPNRWMANG